MGSRLGAIAMQALALILLGLGCARAQYSSCPEAYGLQLYPHEQYCDKFYKCAHGTLYEEVCENGLVFDGHGAVHNHCNYNWAVDCGKRVYDDTPISSPGCLYQFGIYPVGEGCQTTFFKCAAGVAYETPCYKGLAYNPEIHVCDYPDSVRCLRCFQTLLFFHLSRALEPFSLQHSAFRCLTVRNNLRGSLGSNALRPTSFPPMLSPGASSPSQGSQCPGTTPRTSSALQTTLGSITVATTASLTLRLSPASIMSLSI